MTERPILFSAPMVRAILDGTKTQTRRVVKNKPYTGEPAKCPYGAAGDFLWIREKWQRLRDAAGRQIVEYCAGPFLLDVETHKRWHPSIHMPRWASRITLEVTGVRVERLQDISESDAIAEGIERNVFNDEWSGYGQFHGAALTPKGSYRALWESINGPGSWDANPWVWVVEFTRHNAQVKRGARQGDSA